MEPLYVREGLEEAPLEHPGRGHKHPVGRVNGLQVLISVEFPDLRKKHLLGVHDPGDLLLEGADDHAVGHGEGEWVVEFHLLVDGLQVFILEQDASSWVMALEGAHIEDVVVEDNEGLLIGLRVGGDFLHIFEFQVDFRHPVQLLFITE